MQSDLTDLQIAARKLANHVFEFGFDSVGGRLGFGTAFLRLLASFAAMYLLILDRTNWRTNMLTTLLVPYAFFFCVLFVLFPLTCLITNRFKMKDYEIIEQILK